MAERVLERLDGDGSGGVAPRDGRPRRPHVAPPEKRLAHDRSAGIEALRHAHPERLELPGGLVLAEAEAAFAVRVEKAKRLDDVLLRRTRLWLDGRALRQAAEPASRWLARWRSWVETRRREEVARLVAALDAEARVIEEGTA
jgi:glycerol-3-phosphate dehydrogenase